MLYYTILYYSILYYSILYFRGVPDTLVDDLYPYYTILYYTLLYFTILYFTILYYTQYPAFEFFDNLVSWSPTRWRHLPSLLDIVSQTARHKKDRDENT